MSAPETNGIAHPANALALTPAAAAPSPAVAGQVPSQTLSLAERLLSDVELKYRGRGRELAKSSGRIHEDEPSLQALEVAAENETRMLGASPIDPNDPADARLLEKRADAKQRVGDKRQEQQQSKAKLERAEDDRSALATNAQSPKEPWFWVGLLGLGSALVCTVTFKPAFFDLLFPDDGRKAVGCAFVLAIAVTLGLVWAPFEHARHDEQRGAWRWATLIVSVGVFAGAMYFLRNAGSAVGQAKSLGLALIEGVMVFTAEAVAHSFARRQREFREKSEVWKKATERIGGCETQLARIQAELAPLQAELDGLDDDVSRRQAIARHVGPLCAAARAAVRAGYYEELERRRGKTLGNTWEAPSEAEVMKRLKG